MEENSLTIQQNTEIVAYDEAVYDREKMSGLMEMNKSVFLII